MDGGRIFRKEIAYFSSYSFFVDVKISFVNHKIKVNFNHHNSNTKKIENKPNYIN